MMFPKYPKYKPSGTEWLGEIPEHWEVIRVKSLEGNKASVVQTGPFGAQLHAHDYVDEGVPLILIRNVGDMRIDDTDIPMISQEDAERLSMYRLKAGDIVFSRVGSIGRIALCSDREHGWLISGQMLRLRITNPRLYHKFAVYAFGCSSILTFVELQSVGSTRESVNTDILRNMPLPIPPEDEQRAISAFLDRETARIDELIKKKERQIELLQEKRTALISHAVTKGLDPNVKMKNSGIEWLGEIPEHWEVIPLKFALMHRGDAIKTGPFGSQLLSSEMGGGTIKVYNQRNVLDHDFNLGENYITEEKYQELKSFTIFPGDVLVTTRGTIGHCTLFPDDAELGILHPCLMRIQVNSSRILPEYLSVLIQDGGIVLFQLQLMSNATTIDVIYSESLKSVRLPLPPIHEQREILAWINREVAKLDTLLAKVRESTDLLREYRTALITAAVTGKIDVRLAAAENTAQAGEEAA